MTSHLTPEQISRLLAGDASSEEVAHTKDCVHCEAAAAQIGNTFSIFRDAVHDWSDRHTPVAIPDTTMLRRKSRVFQIPRFAWGMAVAVFVFLVALPVYKNMNNSHREPGPDDALLLEQVNAHLSRAVPAPMEPLMELLSEGSIDEVGGRK